MAGLSASGLKTQIRSYTETDSNVLTDAVLENIILNSQYRIFRDVPIDAERRQQTGNLVAGQESINAPAGALFIRGVQVYDSSSVITGANVWLEKKRLYILAADGGFGPDKNLSVLAASSIKLIKLDNAKTSFCICSSVDINNFHFDKYKYFV